VFAVVYGVLYRRVISFLNARRDRIARGIADAHEAEHKLADIEVIAQQRLRSAQEEALSISKAITDKAQEKKKQLLENARIQESDIIAKAHREGAVIVEDIEQEARKTAVTLVKKILVDVIQTSPAAVDTALIRRAAKAARIKSV
jgi:F0F1-type ATP synthase membrane subunit b/b'